MTTTNLPPSQEAQQSTKLNPLQEAQQALQAAARQFGDPPTPDDRSRFTDLALRRAAIEFTRALMVELLGFNNTPLEDHVNELIYLAELSLKARGGICDPGLSKQVRAYFAKWDLYE